jgi:hypothetical protein
MDPDGMLPHPELESHPTNIIQFVLFFGGLSFHMCKALICHSCSINMEWTTTAKELEASGFRVGLDRIVRDFKWMVCTDPMS